MNCCGLEYNTSQRSASAQEEDEDSSEEDSSEEDSSEEASSKVKEAVSLESRSDTLLGVVLW